MNVFNIEGGIVFLNEHDIYLVNCCAKSSPAANLGWSFKYQLETFGGSMCAANLNYIRVLRVYGLTVCYIRRRPDSTGRFARVFWDVRFVSNKDTKKRVSVKFEVVFSICIYFGCD